MAHQAGCRRPVTETADGAARRRSAETAAWAGASGCRRRSSACFEWWPPDKNQKAQAHAQARTERSEITPGQGKVPASSGDLPPPQPAARVGNKDLNLSDWSYDFVRETLEASQEVKKAWL